MGGFFLVSKENLDAGTILTRSRGQFEASGFKNPVRIDTGAYVLDYYPKIDYPAKNHILFDNGDFIFSAGTFIYRGLIGAGALRLFHEQPNHREQLKQTHGHFVIVLRKAGRTELLKDPMGSYEVFVTSGLCCASTSFLAAAAASPRLTINLQEVYEYVFNGVCLGGSTPFAEIRRLDFHERMTMEPSPSIVREAADISLPERTESLSDLVDLNLETLHQYASTLTKLFGGNIRAALSGGYDTRLLLALFRRCGIAPHLFVYGNEADSDVKIATKIARAEALPLHHIDKSLLRDVSPGEYSSLVQSTFHREDAIGAGGIFVNGAEAAARLERNKGGALHVNGGGGEIFRNFFNLLDRPITARQFVWSFYSFYDPSQCSELFDAKTYEDGISAKIAALLGLQGAKLSRRQVESLYPYLRCRSWFARENSVNNRWGYSVLPFFDHRNAGEALRIPIRYKHFGNFESKMIRRADPKLASYPSNYGHSFAQDAPPSAVAKALLTYLRPLRLRPYSFRIRALLEKPRSRPPLLSQQYLDRVIDTKFPYMSKYFVPGKLTSNSHFGRMCTLEYLFNHFSAS